MPISSTIGRCSHSSLGIVLSASLLFFVACAAEDGSGIKGSGTDSSVLADGAADGQSEQVTPDADGDLTDSTDSADSTDTSAPCVEGTKMCSAQDEVLRCQLGSWTVIQLCTAETLCLDGACVEAADCTPGEIEGCYSLTEQNQCHSSGTGWVAMACALDELCVDGTCAITECVPGVSRCVDDQTTQSCDENGNWGEVRGCEGGLACLGGDCLSGCLSDPKWLGSSIGCEYWTLDLDNYADPFSNPMPNEALHGVVLGNPGEVTAIVTFTSFATGIPLPFSEIPIEPGKVEIVEIPRMDIDGSTIVQRSVRIVSNHPIVAYQFSPLDFQAVYSDDSSLLLPAEMLGREYLIISYPTSPIEATPMLGMPSQHGYFTVLAVEEGETKVSVRLAARTDDPLNEGELLAKGSFHQWTLQQGEVLNLQADGSEFSGSLDLSGSHVTADKKIAVFAGHEEAVVQPPGSAESCCCAEHLEEQLFPVNTWSNTYLCVKARSRGGPDQDLWIVQAGTNGVSLTTDPPIPGLDGVTLALKGDRVQVYTPESFVINASGPIQVAQILASQGCTADFIGDPAMIMAVGTNQYRTPYAFAVPKDYQEDYITIIRPAGTAVILDNVTLDDADFQALAGSGYEYGYFAMTDGPHFLDATKPVGLYEYGFSGAASYGNPGGLNLIANP